MTDKSELDWWNASAQRARRELAERGWTLIVDDRWSVAIKEDDLSSDTLIHLHRRPRPTTKND